LLLNQEAWRLSNKKSSADGIQINQNEEKFDLEKKNLKKKLVKIPIERKIGGVGDTKEGPVGFVPKQLT